MARSSPPLVPVPLTVLAALVGRGPLLLAAIAACLACSPGTAARGADVRVRIVGPRDARGLAAYTVREAERVFREHFGASAPAGDGDPVSGTVVIGTPDDNPRIKELIAAGFLTPESHAQGYALKCEPGSGARPEWLLVIAGGDGPGALYGLRDLEHFEITRFTGTGSELKATAFERHDFPRIEYRGHWVWGCNMPDKKAWIENMSRWKMNELIHWDNQPPEQARDYVEFAHERGVRVIWGFGWGWNPDWNFNVPAEFDRGTPGCAMCGSSQFNRDFLRRAILAKVRDVYVPTGCDGIYFQAFTEAAKCGCPACRKKSMGQLMLEFVNPIVADIKREFPGLWISCGIHANFGVYAELKDLDPRCNIYWENCPPGVSVRGPGEDFGSINKSLPYGHGFSKTCPADPPFTEASLAAWMEGNAPRYALAGDIKAYEASMRTHQAWAARMLGKPSTDKHASTVADHSVFCRRTPFMHVAFAEALWNPALDTKPTVARLVAVLGAQGGVPGLVARPAPALAQHDAVGARVTNATAHDPKYPGGGATALADGRRAAKADAGDPAWQGYRNRNLDAVVDMGSPVSINALSTTFLRQHRAGVFLPREVEYAFSRDGSTYDVIGTVKPPAESSTAAGNAREAFRIEGLDLEQVRFLRVRAASAGQWLFVDELMVNPVTTGGAEPPR